MTINEIKSAKIELDFFHKREHRTTRHIRFRFAPPILLTQHRICRNVVRNKFFIFVII